MTTTKGPAGRPEPRIRLSSLEWRLYLTTLLSGIYVIAWITFAARAPRTVTDATASNARGTLPASSRSRFVWISDLPVAERPAVSLPPGWAMAASQTPRPEVVRRPATTKLRIRTRTS
jgi:hypothetical protein